MNKKFNLRKKRILSFLIFIISFTILGVILVMGANLPTVGGDTDVWGTILNTYLQAEHDANGSHTNIKATGINLTGNLIVNINDFFVNTANGKVGIGTSLPSNLLDVRGVGNFSSTIYINNATDVSTFVSSTAINESYALNVTWDRYVDWLGGNLTYVKLDSINNSYALNITFDQYVDWIGGNTTYVKLETINNSYGRLDSVNVFAEDNTFTKLLDYHNISSIPTCTGTDKLFYDGTDLSCEADDTGAAFPGWDVNLMWKNETGTNTTHIVDRTITTDDLADDSVNSSILDVSDVSDDIAGDIAEGELTDDSVVSDDIKDGTITNINLASTLDVANYTAGDGNITITNHVITLVYTELLPWLQGMFFDEESDLTTLLDDNYQASGAYLTSTQLNASYALNTSLEDNFGTYNYNMSIGYAEFQYNMTTGAEVYAKAYADTEDAKQDECSEITGCVENAISSTQLNASYIIDLDLDTISELNTQITDVTAILYSDTLTDAKWCVATGTAGDIDCNVEPVTDTDTHMGYANLALTNESETFDLNLTVDGFIGIGTSTPSAKLDVEVSSGGAATIGSSGNTATGDYAVAIGQGANATGNDAIAMGKNSIANATYGFSIGYGTVASGTGSLAMGLLTTASGSSSMAMGWNSIADGSYSTAMGRKMTANGDYSFGISLDNPAENYVISDNNVMAIMGGKVGIGTVSPSAKLDVEVSSGGAATIGKSDCTATGDYAVAMGRDTNASGARSTAMGYNTIASGYTSMATGYLTEASGYNSIAMGREMHVDGTYSVGIGLNDPVTFHLISDDNVMAIMGGNVGIGTVSPSAKLDVEVSSGGAATIGSSGNTATGNYAVAMGSGTNASEFTSTAMGWSTIAKGAASTAMGYLTEADGSYSTAMGQSTSASGTASTAMGKDTEATRTASTAMGRNTIASGITSTAMGQEITAQGTNSFGIGLNDPASNYVISDNNVMAIMGGSVGIGTTSPNQTLDVHGEIQGYDFITSSDRELKDNIKELNINDISIGAPKLYEYHIKKPIDIYELQNFTREIEVCETINMTSMEQECHLENETYQENIKIGEGIELQPLQVGLMQDEVPEICRVGGGVSNYCLLSIAYVKIAELEKRILELEKR